MKHELIKTEKYLLVLSDAKITGYYYDFFIKKIHHSNGAEYAKSDIAKKIISHLPLNGEPYLDGVDVLPEIEDGSNSDLYYHKQVMNPYGTGEQSYTAYEKGFIDGYNKFKETYRYTEEDLRKSIEMAQKESYDEGGYLGLEYEPNEIIQSLNQPKLPVAFECDMKSIECPDNKPGCLVDHFGQVKITNSEGRTEWVGKYLS